MRTALAALLLLTVSTASAQDLFDRNKELTVEEKYELGLKYLKRGYYVKAQEQFNEIRNKHRDDPYAVKAELALADMHFKQNEWDLALWAYEDFLRLHPHHAEVPYVVYRKGLTQYKKAPRIAGRDQTWTKRAVDTWSSYGTLYPESENLEEVEELLGKARDRLARKELQIGRFYYQRDAWAAVEGRIEPLIVKYPESPDSDEALFMLAHALYELDQVDRAEAAAGKLAEDHPDSRMLRRLERKAPALFEDAPAAADPAPEATE